MLQNLWAIKTVLGAKMNRFIHDERGDVNIVSIVVLIGVAVILAILFKDAIGDLLTSLLKTIQKNADKVGSDTLPPVEFPE